MNTTELTTSRWQSEPGSFDALHTRLLFGAQNRWGIPELAHNSLPQLPNCLMPYGQRVRSDETFDDMAVHFFLDDYRFERVWNRPFKALASLKRYRMVLTPDFSLYHNWPLTLQLWNTYRSRWCGCLWQEQGLVVIPTVSWGTEESYRFCFAGIPRRSVVAVSTVGVNLRRPEIYHLFMSGYQEMVRRLEPAYVLSYGLLPPSCSESVPVRTYPTYWTRVRAMRRAGQAEARREQQRERRARREAKRAVGQPRE